MIHFHCYVGLPEAIFKNFASRIFPDDIVSDERLISGNIYGQVPRKRGDNGHGNNSNSWFSTTICEPKIVDNLVRSRRLNSSLQVGISPQLWCHQMPSDHPALIRLWRFCWENLSVFHGETMGLAAKSIRIEGCPANWLVKQLKANR